MRNKKTKITTILKAISKINTTANTTATSKNIITEPQASQAQELTPPPPPPVKVLKDILSTDVIETILENPAVVSALAEIYKRSTNGSVVYFTMELTPEIKAIILETMGLDLSGVDAVPMRWVNGDTMPHIDKDITNSTRNFENTYLMYVTGSAGQFIIDKETYPITAGTGYIFNEGLYHSTVDTGTEPRLLMGPMSEAGIPVGTNIIPGDGGSTIYIQQDGTDLYYSFDQINLHLFSLPIYIQNTDTAGGYLKVVFTTDITFNQFNQYFICHSSHIQFGSTSLKNVGTRPVITIDNVSNYPGFIKNGDISSNGNSNICIMNLEIAPINSSTLANNSGWFGQTYFGKSASNNYIVNCSSSGDINGSGSGGIVGSYAAMGSGSSLTIIGCSSIGIISGGSGGIVGTYAGYIGGNVAVESCWSTGLIDDDSSGGIVGSLAYNVAISNCYSTGIINGPNTGGILGSNGGIEQAVIQNCYSTGNIMGGNAGGICGSLYAGVTDTYQITINNCYTTGNLDNTIINISGGICGPLLFGVPAGTINLLINHCYTTGTVVQPTGYFIGAISAITGSDPIKGYTISNSYSEAGSPGGTPGTWSDEHAKQNALIEYPTSTSSPGVGSTWVSTVINNPYELFNMGYSPYSTENIFYTGLTPSLKRQTTSTIEADSFTIPAIVTGASYTILQISGGSPASYSTITMNSTNGRIFTTTATTPGVYTIYLRNNGSYNNTRYILTVTAYIPPEPPVPCLTEDVEILTPSGYTNICDLKNGDHIITSDGRTVTIKNIFTTRVAGCLQTWPYLVAKNSIGPNYPPRDFRISGNHLIRAIDNNKWICPRRYFTADKLDKSRTEINYYHIELPNYITDHMVINGGTVVESLANNPYNTTPNLDNAREYYRRIGQGEEKHEKKIVKNIRATDAIRKLLLEFALL